MGVPWRPIATLLLLLQTVFGATELPQITTTATGEGPKPCIVQPCLLTLAASMEHVVFCFFLVSYWCSCPKEGIGIGRSSTWVSVWAPWAPIFGRKMKRDWEVWEGGKVGIVWGGKIRWRRRGYQKKNNCEVDALWAEWLTSGGHCWWSSAALSPWRVPGAHQHSTSFKWVYNP